MRYRQLAYLLVIGALIAAGMFALWEIVSVVTRARGDFLAFNDFFAQWSFARFIRTSEPATIFDPDMLHRFQLGLEPRLSQTFPFPYPPSYLFVVAPLGWIALGPAQLVWDVATLALFAAAVGARRGWSALAAALAPATIMSLAYGQNGLLIGALVVGGFRLVQTRPKLAGAIIGLATIKPTLGLLLPVALIAARESRVILSAAVTAIALGLLSAWAFGPDAWIAWFAHLFDHAAWLEAAVSDYRKPTVLATLSLFGLDPALAQAGQVFAAIVVVCVVWLCCRRGLGDDAVLAVLSGTFLALPFAFVYDLPMVAGAIVLVMQHTLRSGRRWSLVEAVVLALGYFFPALTTLTTRFFYMNTVALTALFALAAYNCLRNENAPALRAGAPVAAAD